MTPRTSDTSIEATSVRDWFGRANQYDGVLIIGKTENEAFAHESADLFRREIDDGGNLPSHKIFGV